MKFIKLNAGYIIIALACLGFMTAEMINHRFWLNDYTVYHHAAINMMHGDELYKVWYAEQDSTYIYKYSPVAPVYFMPFAVMPLPYAKIAYWIFLTAVIVFGFVLATHLYNSITAIKNNSWLMVIVALPLAVHFLRELHLGQVNFLLLVIYMLAAFLYIKNKTLLSVFFLAASFYLKPFALIFLPYFLLRKDFKAAFAFIISMIILFFVPLLFYHSVHEFTSLYKSWFNELLAELGHKQNLFKPGNQTVFSVIARYTPLGLILTNPKAIFIFQLAILAAVAIVFYKFYKSGSAAANSIAFDFAFLICCIPLLSFTSENAFGFTGFAIAGVVLSLEKLSAINKIIFICAYICIGISSGAILGSRISNYLDSISIITIGTLLLIYVLIVLRKSDATLAKVKTNNR